MTTPNEFRRLAILHRLRIEVNTNMKSRLNTLHAAREEACVEFRNRKEALKWFEENVGRGDGRATDRNN